jgi:hypothetical protein
MQQPSTGAAESTRRRYRELVYADALEAILHVNLIAAGGLGPVGDDFDIPEAKEVGAMIAQPLFHYWKQVRAAAREVRLELGLSPVRAPDNGWPVMTDDQLDVWWEDFKKIAYGHAPKGDAEE